MFSKYSVKKPMTVFVAVIMILILGFVSFTGMTTDLLPSLELPYVLVMTTYPGATPEKVELSVSKPLEQALATTSGLVNISSSSMENASMVILEFDQAVNMDSVMLEISSNIDMIEGMLPDGVSAPMTMKINPDMMPVMMASVSIDGMEIEELSSVVTSEILSRFERINGVGSVTTTGLYEEEIKVTLSQAKIDELNKKILASIDSELAETQQELIDAQKELDDGRAELLDGQVEISNGLVEIEDGEKELEDGKSEAFDSLADYSTQISQGTAQMNAMIAEENTILAEKMAFEMELEALEGVVTMADGIKAAHIAQVVAGGGTVTAEDNALSAYDYISTKMTDEEFLQILSIISQMPTTTDSSTDDATTPVLDMSSLDRASFLDMLNSDVRIAEINTELTNINTRLMVAQGTSSALESELAKLTAAQKELELGKMEAVNEMTKAEIGLSSGKTALEQAQEQLDSALTQLDDAQEQLDDGLEQFNEARDEALKSADMSGVITPTMLSQIFMAQNFNMPAGAITQGIEEFTVKVGDTYNSIEDLENAILMHLDIDEVGDVHLYDVANIEIANNKAENYTKINGTDGVILSFQKQSTYSTNEVTSAIHDVAEEIKADYPGFELIAVMDQGVYIDMVVDSVLNNLIYGGLLAILILLLFLKDWKPTLIIAFSIPISLMFAIVLMYFSDVTLNIISLSGLALGVGMLVDNSIVVIENIYRLRNLGLSKKEAAIKGATQVAGAIFASTLTTICVFLPIVFTDGISRQLFTDMGLTIGYSLVASLIVALTLVPAMSANMLTNTQEKKGKFFDKIIAIYKKLITATLRRKAFVLLFAVALLVVSVGSIFKMGTSFIPEMSSPQMSLTIELEKGSTKEDTQAMSNEVVEILTGISDIETIAATNMGSGMGALTGGAGDDESMSFYLLLSDEPTHSSQELATMITEATSELDCEVSVSASQMDMSALSGSGISVQVKGDDLDTLQELGNEIKTIMETVEGTTNVTSGIGDSTQELRVIVDKTAAMQYGLTVAQIYGTVADNLTTETTGTSLTIDSVDYPVILVKDEANNVTYDNLMDMEISGTQEGEDVDFKLSDVALKEEALGMQTISRDNQSRYITPTAQLADGYNIGLVSADVEKALEDFELPNGYSLEFTGENETITSAMGDLVLMILLAIVFIYLIMVAQFQSLMSPFIVLFTIPLAFTGGLLALIFTGSELSIISMLGFLVLSGVVVNNGIVFVDYVNQLRSEGVGKTEALIEAGCTRMRPILMTALTTMLAMSTMALGIGSGSEMTQPMAIVTIGGLAYSTLMTLFVVPALYDLLFRKDIAVQED